MTVKSYDREALKAARLAGATVAELMVAYDCSESVIRTRLHRMGVKLPAEVTLARAAAGLKAWRSDPANEAKRHARAATQWTPERRAAQGELGRRSVAERVAWCPPAYRARYDRLIKSKRLLAVEARRIIEADIARDEAKRLAALTPFQRMLDRAQRGQIKLLDLDVVQPRRAPLRERDGVRA